MALAVALAVGVAVALTVARAVAVLVAVVLLVARAVAVRYPLSNYIGMWREMHLETHASRKLIPNLNFLTSGNAMNSSYI